jgi:hypothetical protein
MKTNINTQNFENDSSPINNVHSFTSITGNSCANYYSTSTSCIEEKIEYANKKYLRNYYTINLDWFQFLCQIDKNGNVLESYSSERIKITKSQSHNNPNFKYKYTVALDFCNLCDIYAIAINSKHKKNEISVKIHNSQLYTKDWFFRINYLLTELGFTYKKLSKIDIALDGRDVLVKMSLFRRYLRTKTIQINNENLKINGSNFNKAELNWESYTIGSKKYQKTAELYNKTKEIKVSGKQYIADFWMENGLDISDDIGRFELRLGSRHLSKYKLNSFSNFCDAGYLGQLLMEEVGSWLKFYQVSLETVKNHRKDIAIRRGKELKFIHWDKIPHLTMPLDKVVCESDGTNEAKKSITRAIGEIQKGYAIDSTATLINFIEVTATEYRLQHHAIKKIFTSISRDPKDWEKLQSLVDRLSTDPLNNFSS